MLPYDVERIRQGLSRVNVPPPGNQIIEDAKGLLADRDALLFQIDGLKKQLLADFMDKMPEGSVLLKRDKWEETNRLNGEMRELLSQYQSNIHLFKHDAKIALMDCQIEPCPKTTKAILGADLKRIPEPHKLEGCLVCGGRLTMIRGKHPGEDDREVCPTCATERLEDFLSSQQPVAQQTKENRQP